MRYLIALSIIFGLILLACAPSKANSTPPAPTQPPVAPATNGSLTPTPALPGDAVIFYHRSGGIAGLDEIYTIYSDGRITTGNEKEWQVSPQAVQRLLKQIEQAGFFLAEQTGPVRVPCCDRFTYSLEVSLNGKTQTAQTYDGAQDQPKAIQSAFEYVADFILANTAPDGSEPVQ